MKWIETLQPHIETPACTRCNRVTSEDDPEVRFGPHSEVIACGACETFKLTTSPKPARRSTTYSVAERYRRRFGGLILYRPNATGKLLKGSPATGYFFVAEIPPIF